MKKLQRLIRKLLGVRDIYATVSNPNNEDITHLSTTTNDLRCGDTIQISGLKSTFLIVDTGIVAIEEMKHENVE